MAVVGVESLSLFDVKSGTFLERLIFPPKFRFKKIWDQHSEAGLQTSRMSNKKTPHVNSTFFAGLIAEKLWTVSNRSVVAQVKQVGAVVKVRFGVKLT